MVTKPAFSFDDLDKLDYAEINLISNKYGEEEFNPKDMLDFNEDGSDGSEEDEIMRRFRNKSKITDIKTQDGGISEIPNVENTPNHFMEKKFSKPSNYSYQESQNSYLLMNKLHDRTLASQDLGQMQLATRNLTLAASENPAAKIGKTSG